MTSASLPSFWIGLTLIAFFSVRLHWFPVAGYGPPDVGLAEHLRSLVLPAIAVGGVLAMLAVILAAERAQILGLVATIVAAIVFYALVGRRRTASTSPGTHRAAGRNAAQWDSYPGNTATTPPR